MKRNTYTYFLLIVVGVGLAYFGFGIWHSVKGEPPTKVAKQGSAIGVSSRHDESPDAGLHAPNAGTPRAVEQMKSAFDKAAEALGKLGITKLPSAANYLKTAMATHDKVQILRAFNELIYSGKWKTKEIIPVLKEYSDDADVSVRYLAGNGLLTVGDESGSKILIKLVSGNDPIIDSGRDLRVEAAMTLAKFQRADATDAILQLDRMGADGLGEAYADLGMRFSNESKYGFHPNSLAITEYAEMNATAFLPQIMDVFQHSQNMELKTSAAWALATMQDDEQAINFLVQTAQPFINGSPGSSPVGSENALKYLGSVQNPLAKSALESSLDSQNPLALEVAATNLIINQGGSQKAVDVIARQLNGDTPATSMMSSEVTLSLAAQLGNDPQIEAAGQRFSARSPDLWQLYAVDRASWPIYSWVWNYTRKINR